MPTATITARYVNAPGPGKKNGTVKTPDNVIYGCPPALLTQFKEGGTYEIFYEEREYQGRMYSTIKTAKPAASQANGAGRAAGAGGGNAANDKSEEIFVYGCVMESIKLGRVDPADPLNGVPQLLMVIENARQAYKVGWSRKIASTVDSHDEAPEHAPKDDMSDSIPW